MKYVITDSIKSVNRIIRRENYGGVPSFGVEAITALGLAWQIVMEKKSENGIVSVRLISNSAASAVVLELILKNPASLSFVPKESIALATAVEILNNMNLLRTNKYDAVSDFRVSELQNFIELYEATLKERFLYDEPMVFHEAIDILKEDYSMVPSEEIEICYYKKPSMLEEEFVSVLNLKGEFRKPENTNTSYSFVKAYGISNEADYVAKTIIENKIPLGDVEIVCDTAIYAPFIKECFCKRGLAYNFTASVNGSGFNFIQILKNLIDWNLNGCKYEDLFNVMCNPVFSFKSEDNMTRAMSAYLKGIDYGIGWDKDRYENVKRPGYDVSHGFSESEYHKCFREVELSALKKLADNLGDASTVVDVLDALTTYGNAHKFKRNIENRYTTNAILNLRKKLESVKIEFSKKEDMFEYLKNELDNISYSQPETYDAVNVSSIYTPACIDRKHVFVLGLSAKEFKISVAESPVMNDALRIKLFGAVPCGNVGLAENAIDDAEKVVRDLLKSVPEETEITIISSSADNMRDSSEVATSALFEKLLAESGKTDKDVIKADTYNEITTFDASIAHNSAWDGYKVIWPAKENSYTQTFSKSSLDMFLGCPLKYHYDKDLHINKEEYTSYDPGVWLSANERGTLVHRILELYANTVLKGKENVSEDFDRECNEFKEAVEQAASEAEIVKAAPSLPIKDAELQVCIDMAASYLAYLHKDLHNNGWVVFSCEEDMDVNSSTFTYNFKDTDIELKFTGIIDRVDRRKNDDGTYSYRIQDYKTGNVKKANAIMKETKQHLIYAHYIKNAYKGEVESFDYLYLKGLMNGEKEWIATIDATKLASDVLDSAEKETTYKVLAEHDYTCIRPEDNSDVHRYCTYKDICLFAL